MQDPDPRQFNLAAYVLARGALTPDKVALAILTLTGAERWSYGRLIAAVRGAGHWLGRQGLQPGDRILMRMGNRPAHPVLYLGAIAAGMVPVAPPPALDPTALAQIIAAVRPRLGITADGMTLPAGLPAREADLAAWEASPPCDWHHGPIEREACLAFTAGTSGPPLVVRHAHRAILARAPLHQGWQGLTTQDRLLHAGALNAPATIGPGLIDPWTLGATALIPAPAVSPQHLGLVLRRHDATILAATPDVFRRLLRGELPGLPRLRHGLSTGEALPPALRAAWFDRTGTDLHDALGMAEVPGLISGNPQHPAPLGAIGYPQAGRRIAVLSPDRQPLPPGQIGQLAVSTGDPGLMLSYLDHTPPQGAWFATGDLVHQDHGGAVYYHGRSDAMMAPGGLQVSPHEVEQALADLPGVTDLAVAEIEVAAGTRVVMCFYAGQPLPDGTADAFAAERLARYKAPRAWIHVTGIPRGATGKVDRRLLPGLLPAISAFAPGQT